MRTQATDQGWGAGLVINELPRVRKEHAETTFLLPTHPRFGEPARELEAESELGAGIFHRSVQLFCTVAIFLLVIGIHQAARRAGDPIPPPIQPCYQEAR